MIFFVEGAGLDCPMTAFDAGASPWPPGQAGPRRNSGRQRLSTIGRGVCSPISRSSSGWSSHPSRPWSGTSWWRSPRATRNEPGQNQGGSGQRTAGMDQLELPLALPNSAVGAGPGRRTWHRPSPGATPRADMTASSVPPLRRRLHLTTAGSRQAPREVERLGGVASLCHRRCASCLAVEPPRCVGHPRWLACSWQCLRRGLRLRVVATPPPARDARGTTGVLRVSGGEVMREAGHDDHGSGCDDC